MIKRTVHFYKIQHHPIQDVYSFKQEFDGHLFVGSKGNQLRATVEYAPYQKTPTLAPKKDTRDGTIEKGAWGGAEI